MGPLLWHVGPAMVDPLSPAPTSFGGILFPLDMFRPSMLASAISEGLVAQARNILNAKLRLTRHAELPLIMATITGTVVGDDPGEFWRENVELGLYASQALPRQCFVFFGVESPEKRQGFVVAQRGQVLAGEDATPDRMPEGSTDDDWPLPRLCAQIRIEYSELVGGFDGGPTAEVPLVEPSPAGDQAVLEALAGQPGEAGQADAEGDAQGQDEGGEPPISDEKRRAQAAAAEQQAREQAARAMQSDLRFEQDELGLVVAPKAEIGDADLLTPYLVREVTADLPPGLPRELNPEMQGKRVDVAVVVEFLSEVFYEDTPLAKPQFEADAKDLEVGGETLKALEVLAPRLGSGTLLRRGRAGVFVSRPPSMPLPGEIVRTLLDAQE